MQNKTFLERYRECPQQRKGAESTDIPKTVERI